jgi:hypothetical protein
MHFNPADGELELETSIKNVPIEVAKFQQDCLPACMYMNVHFLFANSPPGNQR